MMLPFHVSPSITNKNFPSFKTTRINVLDLCSSWISHLPKEISYERVVGVGMNEEELAANKQLTNFCVQDLNQELTKPLEIFKEMLRVLRPDGVALLSFSNRCFPMKAVAMWLQADDIARLTIVASYFHYSAKWESIEALDHKEKLENPTRLSAMDLIRNPALGMTWMDTVDCRIRCQGKSR
jgi:SAM-dependent methyltransferase